MRRKEESLIFLEGAAKSWRWEKNCQISDSALIMTSLVEV
jgi:hypothetical protein